MSEPTSAVAALTVGTGLTVFGVATGLHPSVLLAGLAGGLWSLSYDPPAGAWRRVAVTCTASIVAGYLAPAVAAGVAALDVVPRSVTVDVLQLPLAVLIGLVSRQALGPALLRIVTRKSEEVAK